MKLSPEIIAEGWIDLHKSKLTKQDRAIGEWANEALDLAIYNDAYYAFDIIEAIHELDHDQSHMDSFSAGPIESLLTHQGVILNVRRELIRSLPRFWVEFGSMVWWMRFGLVSRRAVDDNGSNKTLHPTVNRL